MSAPAPPPRRVTSRAGRSEEEMAALGEPVRLERGERGRATGAPARRSCLSCRSSPALRRVAVGPARAPGTALPVPPGRPMAGAAMAGLPLRVVQGTGALPAHSGFGSVFLRLWLFRGVAGTRVFGFSSCCRRRFFSSFGVRVCALSPSPCVDVCAGLCPQPRNSAILLLPWEDFVLNRAEILPLKFNLLSGVLAIIIVFL